MCVCVCVRACVCVKGGSGCGREEHQEINILLKGGLT